MIDLHMIIIFKVHSSFLLIFEIKDGDLRSRMH